MPTNLTLRTSISPYGDTTKGSVLSQAELDANFIGLKGDIIYTAQTNGNTVTLKKFNGNDLSFNAGSGSGNKWYIPENTTVTVSENYQGFIYGDLYIDGTLQLDTDSKFVVLNGNVYYGSGGTTTGSGTLYVVDVLTFDTFVTGGTYDSSSGIITFTNNSGNTFTVTGITTSSAFTGGTVTGATNFTAGLTAVTISATTYENLPQDVYVTGGTWNVGTYELELKRNDDVLIGPFNLSILATDMTVTGGTYNPANGVATFVNNSGGTFNITGFLTGYTDVYVTGFTNSNNTFSIKDSSGNTINTTLTNLTGLTVGGLTITGNTSAQSMSATTISATTYVNTPRITGGTYSNGSLNLTTNTGVTVTVTGFTFATSGSTIYSTNPLTSNFNTSNSFFVGTDAGKNSTNSSGSTFVGSTAGQNAANSQNSNFFGKESAFAASGASNSNFFGNSAGYQATGASNSNFFGNSAGQNAIDANQSNFFGRESGLAANSANASNFFGYRAGYSATNANNSNFIGDNAGGNAKSTANANFFGQNAGLNASGASKSIFIGYYAGTNARTSQSSIYIGDGAGQNASGTTDGIFIGDGAGLRATGSNRSIFIGYRAGEVATGTTSYSTDNIIIGTNLALSGGSSASLNIGGVIFGSGLNTSISGTLVSGATANGRIGIRVTSPTATLDVSGTTGYNQLRMRTSFTPSGSGDTRGNVGDIAWDNSYIYVKTSTGWGRTQLNYGF